jgi:hypothetical protein
MLYVMNEVIIKNESPGVGDEYLQAFSKVHSDVIENLVQCKSDELVNLFQQLVQIWDSKSLYIKDYIKRLNEHLRDALNAILNERTGATVIQQFEITKQLEALEYQKKSN